MAEWGVMGTLLLASEGVNATIAGSAEGVEAVLSAVRALPGFAEITVKESTHAVMPFKQRVVKVREELIGLGEVADPTRRVGTYVPPAAWNALIAQPGIRVIDGRNGYEAKMGMFAGAEDWDAADFKDFPGLMRAQIDPARDRRVAMYCTGGIRCEKLSSYFLDQGVEEVFHLDGGILRYLEEIPPEESTWQGACYVFDERVAVGHGVTPVKASFCPACGHPVAEADWTHPLFLPGIRCQFCD